MTARHVKFDGGEIRSKRMAGTTLGQSVWSISEFEIQGRDFLVQRVAHLHGEQGDREGLPGEPDRLIEPGLRIGLR